MRDGSLSLSNSGLQAARMSIYFFNFSSDGFGISSTSKDLELVSLFEAEGRGDKDWQRYLRGLEAGVTIELTTLQRFREVGLECVAERLASSHIWTTSRSSFCFLPANFSNLSSELTQPSHFVQLPSMHSRFLSGSEISEMKEASSSTHSALSTSAIKTMSYYLGEQSIRLTWTPRLNGHIFLSHQTELQKSKFLQLE